MSAIISYQQLSEVLDCTVAGSTKPDPKINKEGLRAIIKMLHRAGLIEKLEVAGKGLVFRCILADSDYQDQNQNNPKTTPPSNPISNPKKSIENNIIHLGNNPESNPPHASRSNPPPVSGKDIEVAVATSCPTATAAEPGSTAEPLTGEAKKKPANATPYGEILDLYREILPTCEQPLDVEHWTPARKATIRARWQNQLPDMESWRECFSTVAQSKFLTGQAQQSNGRKPFRASLFWIAKPENLLKIYEGKYHG